MKKFFSFSSSRCAIASLDSLGIDKSKPILSSEEKNLLSTFSLPLRVKQFLGTRLLLQELFETQGYEYFGLYKDSFGKPYPVNHKNLSVSLSHSQDYVSVAFTTGSSIGIDIQILDERVFNVKKKFLTKKDKIDIHNLSNLTLCWSAKEAAYKALSGLAERTLFSNISVHIEKESFSVFSFTMSLSVNFAKFDSFCFVIVVL